VVGGGGERGKSKHEEKEEAQNSSPDLNWKDWGRWKPRIEKEKEPPERKERQVNDLKNPQKPANK